MGDHVTCAPLTAVIANDYRMCGNYFAASWTASRLAVAMNWAVKAMSPYRLGLGGWTVRMVVQWR